MIDGRRTMVMAALLCAAAGMATAQESAGPVTLPAGPFNVSLMPGGIGVDRELADAGALVAAGAPYTLSAWVRPSARQDGEAALVALGDPATAARVLMLRDGRAALRDGTALLTGGSALPVGRWTHVAAVSDGRVATLYVDGRRVASGAAPAAAVPARLAIGPVIADRPHFGGDLIEARAEAGALPARDLSARVRARPDFDLVQMWRVGVGWPFQKQANIGLTRQQDAWTLPQSRGDAYSAPVAKPVVPAPVLAPVGPDRWQVNGWELASAADVTGDGATLSGGAAGPRGPWRAATVPGTVLTTLIDRGVYPDPYYGLNNLRIPESLSRQDWWYRTRFAVPAAAAGKRLTIEFGGINYASEVWLNGRRLGETRGAFIRGRFDIVPQTGDNTLVVRVSPPPHPGIPHEQSVKGGVGENGGQLAIDGPTFVATEGWDWIPGIRDRNTGIWRPVVLEAHGAVRIGDPQVVTDLPLPRTDRADIYLTIPVVNEGAGPRSVTVRAGFDDVRVERTLTVAPGTTEVRFAPAEYRQLAVANPRLWWPNGYGDPALHDLSVELFDGSDVSDRKRTRFGMREVSYDLSLFDWAGSLRRVNVQPTNGVLSGTRLIDVRHEAIKQTPRGWVESLTPAGETSPAVTPIAETLPEPHLAIRVNGVRIAARGGNWGMDDALKRVSRDRLAPYFRLERDAHMNIVRNWMGNNNEDEFFDLADENGIMVLNDFWQSTQNFQVEPDDPSLFLANARDTIARYRNHPSIILWFGRNEGVPYPTLNEGLDRAVFELDGTRWFTGSSNVVNLQGSGPYNYRPPEGYFTDLATGFSVETGTPSLSTRESIASYVPAADRWPLGDVLAYHDWHFAGNGDTKTFMAALGTMFGPATGFDDFERKAQMMNLETHKAMFEGFLGHLWTKNSGRLLWMTHPSWPSNAWQIYSSDYDTHAAYYGAKSAAEPLHVQLNLPGNELVVLNTTRQDRPGLRIVSRVVGLDGRELWTRTDGVDALANRATPLAAVPLDRLFAANPAVVVQLVMTDAAGAVVSRNVYWRGRTPADYRALTTMATATVGMTAAPPVADGADRRIDVTLRNTGTVPALAVKLTLADGKGERILPAFYDDNYLSLMPGESRTVSVRYPASHTGEARVALRGWNLTAR